MAYWFRVYELFVAELGTFEVHDLLAREIQSNSVTCINDEKGIPISSAIVWHIVDPYDIEEGQRPSQDPEGRWAYVPLMVTHTEYRSPDMVRRMISTIKESYPVAKRIGFHRMDIERDTRSRKFRKYKRDKKRLHVINL